MNKHALKKESLFGWLKERKVPTGLSSGRTIKEKSEDAEMHFDRLIAKYRN